MDCPIQTIQFFLGVPMHIYQVFVLVTTKTIGVVADGIVGDIEQEDTDEGDIQEFSFPTFTFQWHQIHRIFYLNLESRE